MAALRQKSRDRRYRASRAMIRAFTIVLANLVLLFVLVSVMTIVIKNYEEPVRISMQQEYDQALAVNEVNILTWFRMYLTPLYDHRQNQRDASRSQNSNDTELPPCIASCGPVQSWATNGCLTNGPSHVCNRCYSCGDDAPGPRLIRGQCALLDQHRGSWFICGTDSNGLPRRCDVQELIDGRMKLDRDFTLVCPLELPSSERVEQCLRPVDTNTRHYDSHCLLDQSQCPNCDRLMPVIRGVYPAGRSRFEAMRGTAKDGAAESWAQLKRMHSSNIGSSPGGITSLPKMTPSEPLQGGPMSSCALMVFADVALMEGDRITAARYLSALIRRAAGGADKRDNATAARSFAEDVLLEYMVPGSTRLFEAPPEEHLLQVAYIVMAYIVMACIVMARGASPAGGVAVRA